MGCGALMTTDINRRTVDDDGRRKKEKRKQ